MKKTILPLLFAVTCLPAHATILAARTVTGGANAHGQAAHNAGAWSSANAVSRDSADFAPNGAVDGTLLEFTFGAAASFDSILVVNRNSSAAYDWI